MSSDSRRKLLHRILLRLPYFRRRGVDYIDWGEVIGFAVFWTVVGGILTTLLLGILYFPFRWATGATYKCHVYEAYREPVNAVSIKPKVACSLGAWRWQLPIKKRHGTLYFYETDSKGYRIRTLWTISTEDANFVQMGDFSYGTPPKGWEESKPAEPLLSGPFYSIDLDYYFSIHYSQQTGLGIKEYRSMTVRR